VVAQLVEIIKGLHSVYIEIQQGYIGVNKLKVARSFERQIQGKFCELNNISTVQFQTPTKLIQI
jgi:hypothetical protein